MPGQPVQFHWTDITQQDPIEVAAGRRIRNG